MNRPIRIGINGFGRIGRSVFRIVTERAAGQETPPFEIVAVNDLYNNEQLAYLLRFDSVQGRFEHPVAVDEESMTVNGKRILMTAERDPAKAVWGELSVDVVIEATGVFRRRAQLESHLSAGARKVLLTVPPKDELDAIIVMGVNDQDLDPADRLVSNASCTTNCLAPLAMLFDREYGLEEGLITTVHAYTSSQRLADVPHKDLRRSRGAAANIIPTTTGAAKAVAKVLPHLDGKLNGMAVRVPIPDGSIVDLVARFKKQPTPEAVNALVKQAASSELKGVVEYSEDPLVSTDVIGNSHSSIFDALSTETLPGGYLRVLSWYDNEWGYSNRVIDLVGLMCQEGSA